MADIVLLSEMVRAALACKYDFVLFPQAERRIGIFYTIPIWLGKILAALTCATDWIIPEIAYTARGGALTHSPRSRIRVNSGELLAIGCRVRYSPKGEQLDDVKQAHQTVYAVLDPKSGTWTRWQVLELPPDEQFNFARNACAQWLVKSDGTLLVPRYIGKSAKDRYSTTVAQCRFDGEKLTYVRNGNVLRLDVARGLYEPSLIAFGGWYYLTLRNNLRGYVSVSDDGLEFSEPKAWYFDDGTELGSYNTQQHWLAHSDGLFLVYTRRRGNNDHIIRHRAPLFIAQVNPESRQVIKSTERVLVPERGAELGNFGACAISPTESWVTVSEGMFMKDSKERGAEGATFVARIVWAKPNRLVSVP